MSDDFDYGYGSYDEDNNDMQDDDPNVEIANTYYTADGRRLKSISLMF